MWFVGLRKFFTGPDYCWDIFDTVIVCISFFDLLTVWVLSESVASSSLTILRLLRLTRLARIAHVFRLNMVKELGLMIKGLLGGFQTLFWAMVLLLSAIYVIAVFTIETISGRREELDKLIDVDDFFSTVPRAMFTAFRCFLGDCSDGQGRPLTVILSRIYGFYFTIPYVASLVLVIFGIFNLIIAVYIEKTMNAAKNQDEVDKTRRDRESLRIAHVIKKLVKIFCAAQRVFSDPAVLFDPAEVNATSWRNNIRLSVDDVEDMETTVSKDLFLLVIQDPEVQRLMDELDIPPDRAYLFEVFDADSSGGLQIAELASGLLRVRGEPRKSDAVAALLAVRAVQDMLRELAERMEYIAEGQAQLTHTVTTSNRLGVEEPAQQHSSRGALTPTSPKSR